MFTPFYHQLLRKYHIAFGSMFKGVTILRNDSDGVESQRISVPIEYSPRESWLDRKHAEPTLTMKMQEVQPRLAFEMTGVRYDAPRKLNSMNSRACGPYTDKNSAHRYFNGTPYILTFVLYAVTRNIEDANQILEQIIPTFAPDHTLLVNVLPSVGIMDRMRIVMDGSPQWADSYESSSFPKTREIIQTFTFNIAATFYGPIPSTPPNIIRKVIVDLYDSPGDLDLVGPIYLLDATRSRLQMEDSFRLLDESNVSDIRTLARMTRIEIVPDPIDAAPVKPVNTTTTITDFVDGRVVNPTTGTDGDL